MKSDDDANVKVSPNVESRLTDMAQACVKQGGSQGHLRIQAPTLFGNGLWMVEAYGFAKGPIHGWGETLALAIDALHRCGPLIAATNIGTPATQGFIPPPPINLGLGGDDDQS